MGYLKKIIIQLRRKFNFIGRGFLKYLFIGIVFMVIILLIPIVVSVLMECPLMDFGSQKAESWMGFWGGYLGAILGIAGAITATSIQIKSQTNQIILAANKNDEYERQRIYSDLIINKNNELYQKVLNLNENFSILTDMVDKELKELVEKSFQKPHKVKTTISFDIEETLIRSIDSLCYSIQSFQLFIKNDEEYDRLISSQILDIRTMLISIDDLSITDETYDYLEIEKLRVELISDCLNIMIKFEELEQQYIKKMLALTESILNKS